MVAFTIMVVADFSGLPRQDRPRPKLRRVIPVDADSYAQIRARLYPENAAGRTDVRASWLGLKHLVDAVRPLPLVTVKIWDLTKLELFRDLRNCSQVDQSLFFKRVCEDELGTFGDEACGLIVGDFYLSGHPEDVDLACYVQEVAAMADAPFLCGVSPEFFPSTPLDRHLPQDWRAVSESNHSDFLVCLMPRWRRAPDDPEPLWLHPAYPVAALIGGAMNAEELGTLAANLFPAWTPAPADGITPFNTTNFFRDLQFEWRMKEMARQNLASLGLNVVSASMAQRPGVIENLAQVGRWARPQSSENLARRLLTGRIIHELQHLARRERTSDSASALDRSIRAWVRESVPRDAGSNPLFALEYIGVTKDALVVVVARHQVAGGGITQLYLRVPGVFDDRRPAGIPSVSTDPVGIRKMD